MCYKADEFNFYIVFISYKLHNCLLLGVSTPDANCTDGEIRLVDGENQLEGRVEICLNRALGTIWDTIFGEDDANVVCEQLGMTYNGKAIPGPAFTRLPSFSK